MKLIIVVICTCINIWANAQCKKNLKRIEQLQSDITFLASDNLEGRRMGSVGEKIAAQYIADRFYDIGLASLWTDNYLQNFSIIDGKKLGKEHSLQIFEQAIEADQFAPLPFSANTSVSELVMTQLNEQGSAVMLPISKVSQKKLSNIHDDAMSDYEKAAKEYVEKGAKAVFFYNDINSDYDYNFDPKSKTDNAMSKAVVFINHQTYKKHILPNLKKDWIDFNATIDVQANQLEGRNVGAYIDNHAEHTILIGAHFDHLGYGEDHNSLHTGERAIHNGADDNASGVAAILALAKMLKNKKYKNYNYAFVTFSGEELGLYGSKKFVEMNPVLIKQLNYMINIDMLGRYDDTKKALTIGGVGTSPNFIPTIENSKKFFTVKYDSAGIGPSDHTSFYLANVPVLFFFTGLHTDYHKPSDDVEKINFVGEEAIIQYIYGLVCAFNKQEKLSFTKTKEPKMEGTRFKVTLGIMPDYTFSGNGVRADGVVDGKVGKKAGMKDGDIILQIGDFKTLEIQAYMEALSKFKKGDKTKLKILRGTEELFLDIEF